MIYVKNRRLILAFQFVLLTSVVNPFRSRAEEGSPGVARVSFIQGEVSALRGDSDDWMGVGVNTPLVAGDTIATGDDARTEVQLDFATLLRLDQESAVQIATLDSGLIQ